MRSASSVTAMMTARIRAREVERVAGGAAAHPSGLVRRGAPAADGAEARPCVPGGKSDRRRGQPGVVGVQSVADSTQSGQRIALQETEQLSMGTICALGIRRALGRIGDDDGQPGVTGGITGAGAAFAAEVDGCQAGERRRRARGLRGSRDSDAQVGGGQRSEAGGGVLPGRPSPTRRGRGLRAPEGSGRPPADRDAWRGRPGRCARARPRAPGGWRGRPRASSSSSGSSRRAASRSVVERDRERRP